MQAIGGGLVGGVLSKGSPVAGFMHIGVMMIAAWVSFRVVVGLMAGDSGGAAEGAKEAASLIRLWWSP